MEATKARYDNYRLYRLNIATEDHVKVLQELEEKSDSYIFLGHARHPDQKLTIMVSAHKIAEIHEIMKRYDIEGQVLHSNIQQMIDDEARNVKPASVNPEELDWEHYFHLETINKWLEGLAEKHSFIQVVELGSSFEGRIVKGIRFAKKEGNPTVFIEGGIHAREWISPAVTTFLIHQLLHSDRPEVQDLASNFNWLFFPSINPDGYVYTFESDRLWRKNRKPYGLYLGVDLNRNFDSNWNGTGSSSDPSRYDFCGGAAFSEPETRNVDDFFRKNAKKENIQAYIALHSFSQLIMFPYGFKTDRAPNYDDLQALGKSASEAIAGKHGRKYVYGASIETIYPSSGDSVDWVYEEGYVKVSYIIELRGPPESTNMFILPAEEITPTGEEILEAFIAMLGEGRKRGCFETS